MNSHIFYPSLITISYIKGLSGHFGTNFEKLQELPQFFQADVNFCLYRNEVIDEIITRAIKELKKYKFITIDSRCHMLMPGFWPCIPGWHCDDFYRPTNKQPAIKELIRDEIWGRERYFSEHVMMVIGNRSSTTEFLDSPIELPVFNSDVDFNINQVYDSIIEGSTHKKTIRVNTDTLYKFNCLDMHRGIEATEHGWRYFIRITGSNHLKPKNIIRNQTQIYTDKINLGW